MKLDVTEPFQLGVYLVLTILNLLVNGLGILGFIIAFLVRKFADEFIQFSNARIAADTTSADAIQEVKRRVIEDLHGSGPMGRIIGILECQLYLYVLVIGQPALVGSILIFKAFSNWLSVQPGAGGTANTALEAKSLVTLARFYSYAIGNFASLGWAFFAYELVRFLVMRFPSLHALVWIG